MKQWGWMPAQIHFNIGEGMDVQGLFDKLHHRAHSNIDERICLRARVQPGRKGVVC